jgi:hypothetical protein
MNRRRSLSAVAAGVAAIALVGCSTSAGVLTRSATTTEASADTTSPDTASPDTASPDTTTGQAPDSDTVTTAAPAATVAATTVASATTAVFRIPQATAAAAGSTVAATTKPATTDTTTPTTDTSTSLAADGTFTSTEGGFTIHFDGAPKESTVPSTTGTEHLFEFANVAIDEGMSYIDLPSSSLDAQTLIDRVVDTTAAAVGVKVVSRTNGTIGGQPKVNYEARGTVQGKNVHWFGLVAYANGRLYSGLYLFQSSANLTKQAHAFLDSFKLLGN